MADKSLAPVYETSPAQDFQTPELEKGVIINPFVNPVHSSVSNETGDSGFKYNKFYVTKVVMIPCIILMVVFSLLLVYIIMRHLRSILKLYMSVIFYALSILYFAIQIIILLLYDQVFIWLH